MHRIGQTLGGKFTLSELIGRSELGTVYKAHTSSGTNVAVKVLHSDLEMNVARALLGNAKTISQLRNQRIARILGAKYSRTQDTFIVTEWLEGSNLAEMVSNSGGLSPMRCANLMIQICSALTSLHAQKVPHGNLKPTNVFVSQIDGTDAVTIVDAVGSGVLGYGSNGDAIGVIKHLAPEQLQGLEVDTAVDFFNLGVLAYFLVTGTYPFAAPTPTQTAERIRNAQFKSLRELRPSIDEAYAEFVDRCLKPKSERQFSELRKAAEYLSKVEPDAPEENASTDAQRADSQTPDHDNTLDPDATMAFMVPDELQAFFDEQDLEEQVSAQTVDTTGAEASKGVDASKAETATAEAPFFTESDMSESDQIESFVDHSIDYAAVELSLGPNQQMDDDLPFHSVSVSQSALDQEVSIIEESEGPPEVSSHGLDLMKDDTLGAYPTHLPGNDESSEDAHLETEDIMEALRSTMEAIGPLDLEKQLPADAPVMAVSDFEVLATNEFEKTANNENRFLSTRAQTGLKRPVFTLFLLSLLAIAAVVFQQQVQEEEEADHKRLQMVRQQRIEHMKRRNPSPKKAPALKKVASPATPKEKADSKTQQRNDVNSTPASDADKRRAKPKETASPKQGVSPQSSTLKMRKKPVKKADPKTSKKVSKKKRRPKKAPKVEIVDPFANP